MMLPATVLLKPYSRSVTPTPTTGRSDKPWPTMYDLPSENPEDPGLPDIYHDQQPQLLKDTFQPPAYPGENVFVASDLNLYYDRSHDQWYKRPDWMAVVGVSHLYHGGDQRLSYVVWDEKVIPTVVVELLSPGTENEDLGRTASSAKGRPPTKWDVYEQILQIPYYVVFSRYTNKVQFFELIQGRYVKLPPTTKTLWIPKLQLGLGVWDGVYDNFERQWLRWQDAQGRWILTPVERERQQTLLERERATKAEQRNQQLVAKLRALGIDPESL